MSAQEPRPYALLTLDESDEATQVLAQAHALTDLLNCVYHFPDDGPDPESLAWISGMLFEYLGNIEDLIKTGRERAAASRGVKAPAPDLSTPTPEPTPQKLHNYTPALANAKVSVAAMWHQLERLEALADDPVMVNAWIEMIHNELGKCETA